MTTATKAPLNTAAANVQNTVNASIKETKEDKIARLKSERDDAITSEDFEKAAKLRDEIKGLEWVTEKPGQKMLDAYEQRKTKTKGKTFKSPEGSFWMYLQKNNSDAKNEYPFNAVMTVFPKLEDRNNLEDIKKTIQDEKDKKKKTSAENLQDEKDSEIERLQKGLQDVEGKNEWLAKSKEQMKKWFGILRQKRKEAIEKIRNSEGAERAKLIAELKIVQEENKKLSAENTKMKNIAFGNAKYEDNITPENLKKIRSMIYNRWSIKTDERGIKTVIAYQRIPLVMVRRRMTLKTVANALNNIKDDETTGVDFIMAFKKTRFARYDRTDASMTRRSLLRTAWAGRNLEKFWDRFHKQKDMIMNIITWGTPIDSLPEEERKVLKAIDQRMEFYGSKYLQNIYQGKGKKQ